MTKRFELTYNPKAHGQSEVRTGPLAAGETVEFHWRTPATGIVNSGQNGRFGVSQNDAIGASFTVHFAGKSKADTQSVSWSFGPKNGQVAMQPDTDYVATAVPNGSSGGLFAKLVAH